MRMADLKSGWDVVSNDGQRLGSIRDVAQDYLVAGRRGPPSDMYIPSSAIANVQDKAVHLNVSKRDAEAMGWEQPPRNADELETTAEGDLHRHI